MSAAANSVRGPGVTLLLVVVGAAVGYGANFLVRRAADVARSPAAGEQAGDDHGHDDHAGHDHGSADSLELSDQAKANIGLMVGRVTLTSHERTISIPGMLVERPGRSTVAITAPLTGVVTRIRPIQGEAVDSEDDLFDLRLTHEELVQAQGDYLRVAEELDVIEAEIARLQKLAADGGIANRQVLERQYERQNKLAVLRAQEQALRLHGLSEAQVKDIRSSKMLLASLTVSVPAESSGPTDDLAKPRPKRTYEIQELKVSRGQSVTAGETMAVLADHSELFVEGNAFDKDVGAVNKALQAGWSVKAMLETDEGKPEVIDGLKILYVAGNVDAESRTFHFYLPLTNTRLRDVRQEGDHRFVSWRHRPGQRVQLLVPVERWERRIVLPVDAVAQEGVETYVFVVNGKRFDRKPVNVAYRDRFKAVIADDGSIFPDDVIAMSGAQQMQLALKNKAAGPVDPHAGHNH